MGLFGGDSKQVSNYNETTKQVNQQIKDGLGIGVEGDMNRVTVTDGGAIQRTADIAEKLIASTQAQNTAALAGMTTTTGEAVKAAVQSSKSADAELMQRMGQYGLIGLGILAAGFAWAAYHGRKR